MYLRGIEKRKPGNGFSLFGLKTSKDGEKDGGEKPCRFHTFFEDVERFLFHKGGIGRPQSGVA
jgi:hypothetical protein